jgi:hypothetical protein
MKILCCYEMFLNEIESLTAVTRARLIDAQREQFQGIGAKLTPRASSLRDDHSSTDQRG